MTARYAGKTAWITGGGSGIGRALAVELARQGATVAISGRRRDRLEAVAKDVEALGAKALPLVCDVTRAAELQKAVDTVVETLGGLDVVVANAGFGVSGRIEKLSVEDWKRQFDTNVFGLIGTVRAALSPLRKSRGRLVLMGSVASFVGVPNAGAYSASKHAVRSIGETLAMELAGTGVTCTTIHPGFVESEIGQVDNRGRFDGSRTDRRPQRLMWKAEDAARVMAEAIHKRKREYVFTAHGRLISFAGRCVPTLVYHCAARAMTATNRRFALLHAEPSRIPQSPERMP